MSNFADEEYIAQALQILLDHARLSLSAGDELPEKKPHMERCNEYLKIGACNCSNKGWQEFHDIISAILAKKNLRIAELEMHVQELESAFNGLLKSSDIALTEKDKRIAELEAGRVGKIEMGEIEKRIIAGEKKCAALVLSCFHVLWFLEACPEKTQGRIYFN